MNIFLDTSVLVKLYHIELGTDALLRFLSEHSGNLIITVSDLSRIEFRSALLKQVRIGKINLTDLTKVLDEFEHDLQFMNIVQVDNSIKRRAIAILEKFASNHDVRTLDALQLASAISENDRYPIDFFAASDSRLLKVAKLHFQVYNPLNEISK